MAVVLVEQMVEEVVTRLADQVLVLDRGHVVLQGTAADLSLEEIERRVYSASEDDAPGRTPSLFSGADRTSRTGAE
jgi:ABC-type uncharacterized transport system ATPase subunit